MPNWTTNKLTFKTADDAKKVWEGMHYKQMLYDTDNYGNVIGDKKEHIRFSFESIIQSPQTKEECPAADLINENSHVSILNERPWFNWYSWQCRNWGVKWDACDEYIEDNIIWFNTAWCRPSNALFEGIANKFNVEFEAAADNEDGGWEEIDYCYSPGNKVEEYPSDWQAEENEERYEEDEEIDDEW